jgi:D-sedoheptulose 7-phosphate isomerase
MEAGLRDLIEAELRKAATIVDRMLGDAALLALVEEIARKCVAVLRADGKILLAGNGGSAADAQHLAGEFVSRLAFDRPGLSAFALTTDTSVLTAIGNDYGYEKLFSRQVNAVGKPGDIFFGISTSGRSPNILAALQECRSKGITTVGMTGQSGGDMLPLCDYAIRIPSGETPKIQEGHIMLGHIICALVERDMFTPPSK